MKISKNRHIRTTRSGLLTTCMSFLPIAGCAYSSTGSVDFADANREFERDASQIHTLTLIIDFTAFHHDADSKYGEDAVIDLPESQRVAGTLEREFAGRLGELGYRIAETIHSTGWSMFSQSYRIIRQPSDRDLPREKLNRAVPPFYVDDRYREDWTSLQVAYLNAAQQGPEFTYAHTAALARKYNTDALLAVSGYARIPSAGAKAVGLLNKLSMSATQQERAMYSEPILALYVQLVDAGAGRQIGFSGRKQLEENPVADNALVSISRDILKNYPKRAVN